MCLLRYALPFAMGVAALIGRAAPAPAATVAALPLSVLTVRADRIIVAEVVEVRSGRDSGRGDEVPATLVTVRVERTLKGAGSSHVVLEFLGGRVDGDNLEVFDLPHFAVGDRDVLFLAAGGHRVSPLVGIMRGRFRLVEADDGSRDRVTWHDGRPLTQAELADEASVAPALASASDHSVSLASFETAILARLALAAGDSRLVTAAARLTAPEFDAARPLRDQATARLDVIVNLGTSPALLDGCPDWACALASKHWFQRLTDGASHSLTSDAVPAQPVSLEWGQSVFGRLLDTDTLALTFRRTTGTESRAVVVFNDRLSWNAYGGTAAASAPADGPLDLPTVAARELSLVAAIGSASTDDAASGSAPRASARVASGGGPPSRAASTTERLDAASGCGPADVFVDPHMLLFDSPDHALMTAYQVGFFQPGAASPAQVVDVPLTAFRIRRTADLPAWAVAAMQTSLVADIRTAGLATPIGVVYTYRVRGVWAGGTTAWSDSSPPFVRCTTSAAVAR